MSATDSQACSSTGGEPAAESGPQASANTAQEDSLESLITTLHKEIKTSDWLEKNTANKWMEENPDAAKELQHILDEKQAAASQGAQQPSPGVPDGQVQLSDQGTK